MVDLSDFDAPSAQPTAEELPEADQPQPTATEDDAEAADSESAAAPVDGEADAAAPEKKRRNAFNAIEIAGQIAQVQEWLTSGLRPNQIRALCSEHWGLHSRIAESRMQAARRQMCVDANVYDRQEKVGQMLQQLEEVLQQALQMRQGSNAIGALRLQADLLQLLARQN